MTERRPVRRLSVDVARKIAAGEVIDRPAAIVRELMDNAIDAGASSVTVELTAGGIEQVRVVDNGSGMTRDDLAALAYPHSTSKIESETDLLNLTTLGFRGEALSSIAAVSRLSVHSGGFKLCVSLTENHVITPVAPIAGTIVESLGLFENFPARRRFLKRPASESAVCRTTFIEKALARPDIAFKLITDGTQTITLPAGQTRIERFIEATGIRKHPALFSELTSRSGGEAPDWQFSLVIGEPAVSRNTRKDIFIFVNGRRVNEYSLLQAIEYGGRGFFPNGTYPVAALFVTMNPALVDFNIHPAKREIRFHDASALHHAVSTTTRSFFHHHTVKTMADNGTLSVDETPRLPGLSEYSSAGNSPEPSSNSNHVPPQYSPITPSGDTADARAQFFTQSKPHDSAHAAAYSVAQSRAVRYTIAHTPPPVSMTLADDALRDDSTAAVRPEHDIPIRYIGRTCGTFLLAERGNALYIIDQHAAHERILYDRIMSHQGTRQQLLVPYVLATESTQDDRYLESICGQLDAVGFTLTPHGNGQWELSAVPERWTGTEQETRHAILEAHIPPEEIIAKIAAMTACKAAVKDGYVLDDDTAALLAEAALRLPDPHCPHGRPVYVVLTREALYTGVKRT
ncbi:MAG: DNA mismatch repair endonuclease MutL [Treponema sp.]|nr:DNA mismatch repair endonuclease MutL [Treponema sp.]